MKQKYYNLTQKPDGGGIDKMPEWMNSMLEEKPIEAKKEHAFEGIKDPILNPFNKGVVKVSNCSVCNMPLAKNEIGTCSNCD